MQPPNRSPSQPLRCQSASSQRSLLSRAQTPLARVRRGAGGGTFGDAAKRLICARRSSAEIRTTPTTPIPPDECPPSPERQPLPLFPEQPAPLHATCSCPHPTAALYFRGADAEGSPPARAPCATSEGRRFQSHTPDNGLHGLPRACLGDLNTLEQSESIPAEMVQQLIAAGGIQQTTRCGLNIIIMKNR